MFWIESTNIFGLQVSWFTALWVIVTSSNITLAWNILAAYQKGLKDSCRVYDGVSRLVAPGFKEPSWNKGRWRMTWPGSAVWNHSQVTCVFVHPLHLEVLEDGADSTQWCNRPAKGHLDGPDAVFHLFFRSTVAVTMISALTESLCMITACCCSGTEQACGLLFWIWRIFHGNILC